MWTRIRIHVISATKYYFLVVLNTLNKIFSSSDAQVKSKIWRLGEPYQAGNKTPQLQWFIPASKDNIPAAVTLKIVY